jgi:hypothetical protein
VAQSLVASGAKVLAIVMTDEESASALGDNSAQSNDAASEAAAQRASTPVLPFSLGTLALAMQRVARRKHHVGALQRILMHEACTIMRSCAAIALSGQVQGSDQRTGMSRVSTGHQVLECGGSWDAGQFLDLDN